MENGELTLSIPDLIRKKRDGNELSDHEIQKIIGSVVDESMQHSQIGAFLMAIRLNGMSNKEIIHMTKMMLNSGDVMSWPEEWSHLVVDKHSTGGVGDKVSLVLAPALAACGCKVPMISGRGLAHTGGTLDKLESIPGFKTYLENGKILEMMETVGFCMIGQSSNLVPADKTMYSIRDVTSTVDSIPLISSSILSKKAAEGLNALVLDVKVGKAAWSQDLGTVRKLAETLVSVSKGLGIKTTALLTKMDSPLGNMVGHSLEVIESIHCLQGRGPERLTKLICDEGGHLLYINNMADSPSAGSQMIQATLKDGSALDRFRLMMKYQGVESSVADELCLVKTDLFQILPRASKKTNVTSLREGYITEIDALECAVVANALGAGRTATDSVIDRAVGLEIIAHVGQHVKKDDVILIIHHNCDMNDAYCKRLQRAVTYSDVLPQLNDLTLIVDVI